MPAKNVIKEFRPESYYHIYNRGVAKQKIFLDAADYKKFLSYLKLYLMPVDLQGLSLKVSPSRILKNYTNEIKLICYCLMPNHFHLLVWQNKIDSINHFMRSLGTKFSMYFNRRYKRVGPIFQSTYKAVEVESEEQLIYLSKYIHCNPEEILPTGIILEGYKYSSYLNYLGIINQSWVKHKEILETPFFRGKNSSYKQFVEESDERDLVVIKNNLFDLQG